MWRGVTCTIFVVGWGPTVCDVVLHVRGVVLFVCGVVLHVHCLVWCYIYNVCDVVRSYRMWCVLHVQCMWCGEVLPYVVCVTCAIFVVWWGPTVCGVVLHVRGVMLFVCGVMLHVHCLVWCYMYNVCDVVRSYRMWCVLHVQCMWCGVVIHVQCIWCGVVRCYMYNVCGVVRSYRMWHGVVLHVRSVVLSVWSVMLHVQCVWGGEVLRYVVWCGVSCTMYVRWWGLTACGVVWCFMYVVWCYLYEVWCYMYTVWCDITCTICVMCCGLTVCGVVWCYMYVVLCYFYVVWCYLYVVWCYMYNVCEVVRSYRMWFSEVLPYVVRGWHSW